LAFKREMTKFINNGPHTRIHIGPSEKRRRIGLNPGQEIDLPEEVGRMFNLDRVTEGKIGKTKVETKQFEKTQVSFYNKLISLKGIGYKTAKDIIGAFPTMKELIKAIKLKEHLPFRDDVVKKLRRKRW